MPKRIRVNIQSVANTSAVRYEKRNGRDVVVVPSATLPDDVEMNGILYPADEIANSFTSLNRSPAPLGHPIINGEFISARDPEGINIGWIGAWNENARQEAGPNGVNRVLLDKVIDVERANQSQGGCDVLNAIEKGEPVHTSTGLFCRAEAASGDVTYNQIARDIEFDHDAILLFEDGAATPEQGVGMMVNAKGEKTEIEVINSRIDWAESDLAWAAENLIDSAERLDRAKAREALIPRLVEALRGIVSGDSAATNVTVQEENVMDNETKEGIKAINDRLDSLGDTFANQIEEAVKPLKDAQETALANQEARDKAAHDALVNQVVGLSIDGFSQDVAEKMDVTALNALINMNKVPKAAAPVMPGFLNSNTDNDMSPLAGVK